MPETPLAELIPLWRTLREQDVTALVTPALDYVGALELGGLDVRFVSEDVAHGVGEALRTCVGGLEDRLNLQFLYRVDRGDEGEIHGYEAAISPSCPQVLQDCVAERAAWLR